MQAARKAATALRRIFCIIFPPYLPYFFAVFSGFCSSVPGITAFSLHILCQHREFFLFNFSFIFTAFHKVNTDKTRFTQNSHGLSNKIVRYFEKLYMYFFLQLFYIQLNITCFLLNLHFVQSCRFLIVYICRNIFPKIISLCSLNKNPHGFRQNAGDPCGFRFIAWVLRKDQ